MTPQAPVVLVHGMGCGPWVWRDSLTQLPDLDVRPVTLAGHRGGARLRPDSGPATEQMVDDLERWLDDAGIDQAHLVGNSLGGWVALRLAERGRAQSVLCLAPAGGWSPGTRNEKVLMGRFILGRRVARWVENHSTMRAPEAARRALMHPVVARREACTIRNARALVRDLAQCQALDLARGEPTARRMTSITAVDIPTTIVWSGKDRVLDGHWAQERYENLPFRTEILPDVGHLSMLDDPGTVAKLIARQVSEYEQATTA